MFSNVIYPVYLGINGISPSQRPQSKPSSDRETAGKVNDSYIYVAAADGKPQIENVQEKIAVINFILRGNISPEVRVALTETLRTEIVNAHKYTVIDRTYVDQILKEWKFQLSDLADPKKGVEMGKLLGADKIIISSLSLLGETFLVNVSLINVKTAEVEASTNGKCPKCKIDDLIDLVEHVGGKLISDPLKIPDAKPAPEAQKPETKPIIELKQLTEENDPCGKKLILFAEYCFDQNLEKYKSFNINTFEQYSRKRTWNPMPKELTEGKSTLTKENDPCGKKAGVFMDPCFDMKLKEGKYKEFGIESWEQYKELRTWGRTKTWPPEPWIEKITYEVDRKLLVITGEQFGEQKENASILINGRLIPVKTWTDSQIIADIVLKQGEYQAVINRDDGGIDKMIFYVGFCDVNPNHSACKF
ncbi:MAG: hypothetical protein NT030_06395 [Candidatus Saganbacteria bacterium]|nr:hypothetical protein [Candidatus Saganbacteria bacterium]